MSSTPHFPFVLTDDDRYLRVLASDPVSFAKSPNHMAVITFFVIFRAASGWVDIVNVHGTYDGDEVVRQSVQQKTSIPPDDLDDELATIMGSFSEGIRQGSGIDVQWNSLDLSGLDSREEQLAAINSWPHMMAWSIGEG